MRNFVNLLMLLSVASCEVESADEGILDDTSLSEEEQSLSSYYPMAFARVYAGGTLRTYFNTGGAVSVSHTTGNYTVQFAGLSGSGGHVQIAAEGTSNVRCRSMGWSGSPLSASVQCNAPDGTLADSAFTILFFHYSMPSPNNTEALKAYSWVTATGSVPSGYDYNSSGTHNTVAKTGTGSYTVTIANATAINASMMITSYGGMAGNVCSILMWTSGKAWIECRDRFDNLVDSSFTFSYAIDYVDTQQGGHTWFDGLAANSVYTGVVPKWMCSSRGLTGSRSGSLVTIVVSGELGSWDGGPFRRASLVSRYGRAGYCKVESLSNVEGATSTSTTNVRCYTATGTVIAVPQFTFTQVTSDWGMAPC